MVATGIFHGISMGFPVVEQDPFGLGLLPDALVERCAFILRAAWTFFKGLNCWMMFLP